MRTASPFNKALEAGHRPLGTVAYADFARAPRSPAATRQASADTLMAVPVGTEADAPPFPPVEHLRSRPVITARAQDLLASARQEIYSFTATPEQLRLHRTALQEPIAAALDAGARLKALYRDAMRYDRSAMDHAQWLCRHGAQARTTSALPVGMLLVDRSRVLIAADSADEDSADLVSAPGLATALTALFHTAWRSADPIDVPRRRDAFGLSSQRREVLRLLAQGWTDERIARHMGMSVRTARRIAADLLARMGAQSRFQGGASAIALGWINGDDIDG